MSIEKMEYITLAGMEHELDRTLEKCVESGCFHICEPPADEREGVRKPEGENPYKEILKRIIALDADSMVEFKGGDPHNPKYLDELKLRQDFEVTEKELVSQNKEIKKLQDEMEEYKQALMQLSHLKGMNIDVGGLFSCDHIQLRFGRLPNESAVKLSYYSDKELIFISYDDDGAYKWGFYFAPKDKIAEADRIFKSLYFEKIWLPDFLQSTPEKETERLSGLVNELEGQISEKQRVRADYIEKVRDDLNGWFCRIKYLYDIYELHKYALIYKDKFLLTGYVPKRDMERFTALTDKLGSVAVVDKPAENTREQKVPIKLRNNRFERPFSMFVEMYGLPTYGGFNPTTLVAITYTLMFGIMFGDLGQGLLISIIGFIIQKKTGNKLGGILGRVGISSAFFGLMYGSVFGFEELLDPVYKWVGLSHKPIEVMDSTLPILLGAICIGVAIIIVSIIINIFESFKHKNLTEAVFGCNGIAGLVFFCSLLAGIGFTMGGGINLFTMPYVLGLIVLPIVLMYFREPLGCLLSGKKFHLEGGIGDFIASNFFEVFEFLLGYATNTLSFVRIGGFIFSHAGMMSVVMLLSKSVSAGASPIVIIIGNLFVMGMEGLIVGIQVLRLEFYEVFSRFYDGNGEAFEPVAVSYDTNIE